MAEPMDAEVESALRAALKRRETALHWWAEGMGRRQAVLDLCRANPLAPRVTSVRLPTGDIFQVSLDEEVSRQLFLFGAYEELLTLFFLRTLKPGNVFFDVGAHFGYFSVIASRCVDWTGRVVAFEPTPGTAAVLRNNLSGRENCRVVEKAVWRESGTLSFQDAGPALSAFNSVRGLRLPPELEPEEAPASIVVEAVTLDGFVEETGVKPTVIKLDVESAELDAVEGAAAVLEQVRPVVTLEVGDYPQLLADGAPSSRTVLDRLFGLNYRFFELTRDGVRPHALRGHGEYVYDNIVCLPAETAP